MLVGQIRCEQPFLSRGHLVHAIVDGAQPAVGLACSKHRGRRGFALAAANTPQFTKKFESGFHLRTERVGVPLRYRTFANGLCNSLRS